MRKIRTLVIDDEPLARARIVKLLQQVSYISLVGECKNGGEAVDALKQYRPELVFLDVQMPDYNGFEVLSRAKAQPMPFVVFVTAYDQYAIRAFDVHAVDYLLKPYDDERFMHALEHARTQILRQDHTQLHAQMIGLLERYRHQQQVGLDTLEVKYRNQTHLVKIQDIYWISAYGNYLKIHLENRSYLIRNTLHGLAEQLDPKYFLRIHRSLLVHALYVRAWHYKGNNQYQVEMKNGTSLRSGRSFRGQIEQYLQAYPDLV